MKVWEKYKASNEALRKDFMCIPPYESVTGKYVNEVFELIDNKTQLHGKISALITDPWQRAYQIEYCYKECKIFRPYMKIIEYATYDAMVGNWICAYLSLVPAVEAVMRKWYDEMPNLSFEGMRKSTKILEQIGLYDDDRKTITEEHISYLNFIFGDLFFNRFSEYKEQKYSDVFNRNLSLHKLEGVSDLSEGLHNLSRLFLILDIISELYLMQDSERYEKYWDRSFNSDYSEVDFQLRWNLYLKLSKNMLYSSDLNIIENCYYGIASEKDKETALDAVKMHMEIFEHTLKVKRKQ